MGDDNFKNYVSDKIVLTLSDKSDAEKLLGVQVDLNYDF